MNNYEKFGVKEVMDVTFYSLTDHKPVLYVDTLKLSNLENTAEESMARGGRGNPILLTWDYNREASFTIQDALIGFDGLALMTGKPVTTTAETMYVREEIRNGDTTFITTVPGACTYTLKRTPTADDRVFIYNARKGIPGGTTGTVTGTAVTALNVTADFPGTEADPLLGASEVAYIAYYPYNNTDTTKSTVSISSDSFPGYYRIVGDTVIRNSRGIDEPFQLIVEKAKVEPGFSLTMEAEGDPSVFDMNIKVLKPDGENTTMVKMIKYSALGS